MPRCKYHDCKIKVAKYGLGHCEHCDKKYCGRHRLPESHSCDNLSAFQDEKKKKVTDKILADRCVEDQIVKI